MLNEKKKKKKKKKKTSPIAFNLLLPALVFFALFYGFPAFGAELTIPDLRIRTGEDIRVPLIVDQVDRLAGVKLVINYNKELLTFKGGARSKSTDSMMHVINDKTPGKLIVVMAAARGISGKNVTLLTLFFSLKKGVTDNRETLIEATEVQLMGDDLKDIPCKIKKIGTETE